MKLMAELIGMMLLFLVLGRIYSLAEDEKKRSEWNSCRERGSHVLECFTGLK